jgi:flagellar biosynthetic protein FlhB
MANQTGERTERPTGRRLKEARERGQVARSRELSAAISLAGVTLALAWFGVRMTAAAGDRLALGISTLALHARESIEPAGLASQIWAEGGVLARIAAPPALVAAAASIGASVAQVGWSYSPKALALNWTRLSPAQGFQRLSPIQSTSELVKATLGMAALGAICYGIVRQFYEQAPYLMGMMPAAAAAYAWERLWSLLWRSSLALAVLAGADYGYQYWRWYTNLKMTRQEVRDDAKSQDGNPEIKARVRRVQRDMTRRRMLQSVKTATVVVTNPTHYAVALEYRRSEMAAPRVVAKGQDELAARIRKVARDHGVPIVENVALARALHKTAEVGDAIPATLFGAVAEILAYLVRLKQLVL